MSSVASTENVCMFLMNRLYIRDNDKMFSPMGFTACVNEKNETNPLCINCSCRELQFVRDGGSLISWGNCVQDSNASTCTTPRIFCNSTGDSTTVPLSGNETYGSKTSWSIVKLLPPQTTNTPVSTVDSGPKTSAVLVVAAVVSVLLAVAAIVFTWIRMRKKRNEAFGTPTQNATIFTPTQPPLKVATPRFGTRARRPGMSWHPNDGTRFSNSEASARSAQGSLVTDDFVSVISLNETRRIGRIQRQVDGGSLYARFQCSSLNDPLKDTMSSMTVDDDVPSRQDEVSGRSQFTVDVGSDEDDQVTVDFGLSSASSSSTSYWHGASNTSVLKSSRASDTSFLHDLPLRKPSG